MLALVEGVLDFLAALPTHNRYPDHGRDRAYTRSYRISRLVVGFLGVLLPIVFIVGEAAYLRGGVHVRGSLSAYYHTSMQDIYVGGLCVIAFLLITYMAGEPASWDFWASAIAGLALLVLVFFPTSRSGLPADAPACGSVPEPAGCSPVEQTLGEHPTAVVHAVSAAVFIAFLAVMSFLFAISEVRSAKERAAAEASSRPGMFQKPSLFRIHSICGLVIVAAVIWVFAGAQLGELTPLYVGEVASVLAFGVSWLFAGFYCSAPTRSGRAADSELASQG